jgi:structural maintenance of chromosome 1
MGEMGDARVDKFEQARSQKKAEIVEQLKRKFGGVYGRLIDHCEPVHRKYQVKLVLVIFLEHTPEKLNSGKSHDTSYSNAI